MSNGKCSSSNADIINYHDLRDECNSTRQQRNEC